MIGIINAEERFRTLRQTQCVVLQKLTKRRPTTISPLCVHILPATTSGSATVVPVNSAVCTPVVNPKSVHPLRTVVNEDCLSHQNQRKNGSEADATKN